MTPTVIGDPNGAAISVAIRDPDLARAVATAITSAVAAATASLSLAHVRELPVVRLRTHRRLAALDREAFDGAVAIVRVTEGNARRLPELVEAIRAQAPLGVQLVWDGHAPARARVERYVFAVLERARATPGGPPVVLSTSTTPVAALRILIANRRRKDESRS